MRGVKPKDIAHLGDECNLSDFTPEQIIKIFKDATPKVTPYTFKLPIIYGTPGNN